MKKKRTKFLGGVATICWVVGVLLLGIFLSMSVVYANCAGDLCDTNDPKCSETIHYKPKWSATYGCYKASNPNSQGICYGVGEACASCICYPEGSTGVPGQPCLCR